MLTGLVLRQERLRVTVDIMCNIRWYVIITGIRAVDLLIEVIIGGIVGNNTAEAGALFGTSVSKQRLK